MIFLVFCTFYDLWLFCLRCTNISMRLSSAWEKMCHHYLSFFPYLELGMRVATSILYVHVSCVC